MLNLISPLSTVVFEQNEMVIVPHRAWGNLHLKNSRKVFSDHYTVAGSFRAEDTELSFIDQASMTLRGDLSYLGNVKTLDAENLNIVAKGSSNQLFMAEYGNRIDAYNFYIEKSEGSFITATDIYARNNLRLEIAGQAFFSDGGHTLQLEDDLRIRGNENNFNLSSKIFLTAETGTAAMEINGIPLNNLVINIDGDARVDFHDSGPVIRINKDRSITSHSSRPVRLRDKQFHIKGNLLLDNENPEQISIK